MALDKEGYIQFVYKQDFTVTMTISPHSGLADAFQAFEQFLRGAGYVFEGEIGLIEYESIPQDPTAEAN